MPVPSKEVSNKEANYYDKKLHPFEGKAGRNKMGLLVGHDDLQVIVYIFLIA
jgi:hypothetical protein